MATFLVISPEPWTAHAVSKHHYARALASRGHEVIFLNPPCSSGELSISPPVETGVRVVDSPSVARGLRFLPAPVRRLLEARWLDQLEARVGLRVDAVWLFENSRFYDMGFAGERLKIYHQVDLNQNFHPHEAANSADLCLCTTDVIRNALLKTRASVHKIHHGTPVVGTPLQLTDAQLARFHPEGPNAAYVGNLAMEYIDVELLLHTIKAYPLVRFHLVGGFSENSPLRRGSHGLPNVVWWGQQPSRLIPSILAEVDVVMCTYDVATYRDQLASPHKFMEYFASGNTIVSTYTDEYKDKRDLLSMVDAREDYVALFGAVIAQLALYNSPARREARKAFAAMHSYDAQLERIIELAADARPERAELFRGGRPLRIAESMS